MLPLSSTLECLGEFRTGENSAVRGTPRTAFIRSTRHVMLTLSMSREFKVDSKHNEAFTTYHATHFEGSKTVDLQLQPWTDLPDPIMEGRFISHDFAGRLIFRPYSMILCVELGHF